MKIVSEVEYINNDKQRPSDIFIRIIVDGGIHGVDTSIYIVKKLSDVSLTYEKSTISWDGSFNLTYFDNFLSAMNKAKQIAEKLDNKYN